MQVVREDDKNAIALACEFLKQGKIISFATDTVYGIGADANNFKAVEDLYKIKNRDEKKPIAIFLKDLGSAKKIFYFNKTAKKIAEKYIEQGLTMVLKIRPEANAILSKNLNLNHDGFLGFRIVNRPFITGLLKKFDGALAVTSANPAGQKEAVRAKEVEKYFAKNKSEQAVIDLLIDGGICQQKIASTVVKISDEKVTILRQGLTDLNL